MPRAELLAFPAASAAETVSVKVLPAVAVVGAEKLIKYGGEFRVASVEPLSWKITAVIPLRLLAVTVAVPLCPGVSCDGAVKERTDGGVCSTLSVMCVLALFPAKSTHVPLTT